MRVCTGPEMREVDAAVISELGIPSMCLMESAGLAVAQTVRSLCERDERVAVVCGTGNNGADGLVAARHLHAFGYNVDVFVVSAHSEFSSIEGRTNWEIVKRVGLKKTDWIKFPSRAVPDLSGYTVLVDALLGVGLPPRIPSASSELLMEVIRSMNMASSKVVSIDIPSGWCPTTGDSLHKVAVNAHATVALGFLKSGLLLYPAAASVGKLFLAPISIPRRFPGRMMTIEFPLLYDRDPTDHKGTCGKALFVSGSPPYCGAALFGPAAFLRSGGGYAVLHTEPFVGQVVASGCPEIVLELGDNLITCLSKWKGVVVFGSGVGLGAKAKLEAVVAHETSLLVIDGDGLTLLGQDMSMLDRAEAHVVVLTPHLGELARLFPNTHPEGNFYNNVQLVRLALVKYPQVAVVVKGARTAVVSSEGVSFNLSGNSGMATAGSGDVLTGIISKIAVHLASNMDQMHSAVATAVFVHGMAGDIAAEKLGQDGMMASDILAAIPEAIRRIRTDPESVEKKYFPQIV